VSVSNYDQNRQDGVGEFVRAAGMQFPGAGGSKWYVTADGKILGRSPREALAKWKTLPAMERAPGAVKVGELGPIDRQRAAPTPPPGALILKIYYRAFMRDQAGKLRYLNGKDLWHDSVGKKTEERLDRDYPGAITTPQAQPDHMWLAEAEWKALMPPEPHTGDKVALPPALVNRLVRWHLNPLTVYGETNPLDAREVRAAELKLTVDAVKPAAVRLRLDGFARLGKKPPAAVVAGKVACVDQWGYEPQVLGFLEYDPQGKVFTRFDIVVLGDQFGRLGICDSAARIGLQPLGISFELVQGTRPADRVPPGRTPSARTYFDVGR
jgi:hypothetical protein